MKTIFCLDMDQFFVAIEVLHHPHLRGKPVVVGGSKGDKGIVTTASYEARRYGLRAGMAIIEARRLCPHAIFVRPNLYKYVDISQRIFVRLLEFTELVEPVSVDEAYLDVTDQVHSAGDIERLAMKIKRRIFETERLTATIGAGANRLVAKMASNMNKPDGFTYLPPECVAGVFRNLPVGKLHGVGRATEKSLERIGIRTAAQLAVYPLDILRRIFGKWGDDLQNIARGLGDDTVLTPDKRPDEKSMGHEHTFSRDYSDSRVLLGRLHLLCEKVARRLREARMAGRVVTVKVRYHGFETRLHSRKLAQHLQHETDIFVAARTLFHECYDHRPVRLMGVNVSELISDVRIRQLELFTPGARLAILSQACDRIKNRFGEKSIGYASGIYYSGSRSGASGLFHRKNLRYRPFHGP